MTIRRPFENNYIISANHFIVSDVTHWDFSIFVLKPALARSALLSDIVYSLLLLDPVHMPSIHSQNPRTALSPVSSIVIIGSPSVGLTVVSSSLSSICIEAIGMLSTPPSDVTRIICSLDIYLD